MNRSTAGHAHSVQLHFQRHYGNCKIFWESIQFFCCTRITYLKVNIVTVTQCNMVEHFLIFISHFAWNFLWQNKSLSRHNTQWMKETTQFSLYHIVSNCTNYDMEKWLFVYIIFLCFLLKMAFTSVMFLFFFLVVLFEVCASVFFPCFQIYLYSPLPLLFCKRQTNLCRRGVT